MRHVEEPPAALPREVSVCGAGEREDTLTDDEKPCKMTGKIMAVPTAGGTPEGLLKMDRIRKNFGFGCMRLPMQGADVDIQETRRMVDVFLDAGFNYV